VRRSEQDIRVVIAIDDVGDLPCPWCHAQTTEADVRCPTCGRPFG